MKNNNRLFPVILILVLLLALGVTAFAEEPEEDWVRLYEAYYYDGRLQTEYEISYYPDGRTDEYRTHILNGDGTETLEIETYLYDEEGKITGSETHDAETGELLGTAVWQLDKKDCLQTIFRYDAEGNIQSDQQNDYSDQGEKTINSTTYDDNGDVRSRRTTRYNENNDSYYQESFNEDGERVYVREEVFDADGRKVSGTEEGYGSRSSLRYLYDTEGVLQETIETQESGYAAGQVTRTLYYYDEHGNVTEELTLSDGEITSRILRTWGLRGDVSGDMPVNGD